MKISASNLKAASAVSSTPAGSDTGLTRNVVVTDIDLPFWRIVGIMVKWSLASIPAFIILAIIGFCIFVVLAIPGALVLAKIAMK